MHQVYVQVQHRTFPECPPETYPITGDRKSETYIGISLKWGYIQRTATLSMPEYIKQSLQKFQYTLPTTPGYAPHAHFSPTYAQRVQY